jgi:hypothetical protein
MKNQAAACCILLSIVLFATNMLGRASRPTTVAPGQAPSMPKNNPNGIWESTSGTQYQLQLDGTDLKVQLVPGSNAQFVAYEVTLKNSADETNTYVGRGSFTRKDTINGEVKECKYDTVWQIVVVQSNHIVGATSYLTHETDSCQVKERFDPPNEPKAASLSLTKK